MLKLLVIFLLTEPRASMLTYPSLPQKQFEMYLKAQKFSLDNSRNCIALVNTHISGADRLLPSLFSNKIPTEIINGPLKEFSRNFTKFDHVVMFLENLRDINITVDKFLQQPSVWYSNPRYHFILLSDVHVSSEELQTKLQLLWEQQRILNVVIMYLNNLKNLEVFSYNPFENKLLNYTDGQGENFLLKDLKRYKIKMCKDTSYLEAELSNNTCINGKLCNLLNAFLKYLNADFELVVPAGGAKMVYINSLSDIAEGKEDMCLLRMWFLDYLDVYATYPITVANIYALVPKPKLLPFLVNIIYIFDGYTWFLIIFCQIIFSTFNFSITAKTQVYISYLETGLKILLLTGCIYSIIIQNAFQGSVITAISTPKYETEIDTVDDLLASGLKVYAVGAWEPLIDDQVKLHPMSHFDINDRIRKLESTNVYIVISWSVDSFSQEKTINGDDFSNYYHLMKTPVGTGRITYHFRRNSPFRSVFNMFLVRMNDYGLLVTFGNKKFSFEKTNKIQNVKITLEHLYGAFLILAFGLVVAVLGFLGEIVFFSM